MITDSELNLDIPYEYAKDGALVNAHNIVLSKDFTTIQNEPGVKKIAMVPPDKVSGSVGAVILNNRIIIFTNTDDIYTNSDDDIETFHKVTTTHWKWNGGTVFGTATRNVKNEIIVAISERGDNDETNYKVINIDRSINDTLGEEVYKINPIIPQFNITDYDFVIGDKMHKGTYNFYIRYYFDEENYTGWFPIGPDILLYDRNDATTNKNLVTHIISSGTPGEHGVFDGDTFNFVYKMFDHYTEAGDDVQMNITLKLECNNQSYADKFNRFEIAYINTFNAGTEGRIVGNYSMNTKEITVNNKGVTIAIEELTKPIFGLKGINTLCTYNNRIYIGDYIENNKNRDIKNIDTSNIRVYPGGGRTTYDKDIIAGSHVYYNFYLHYVYSDGSFTDGIHIGRGFDGDRNYSQSVVDTINSNRGNELELCVNNNGLGFFKTPNYYKGTTNNLIFSNIPSQSWAIGYFISYEELENIPMGVGPLIADGESICDIFEKDIVSTGYKFKFYYPEFNIIGGSINANKLLPYAICNIEKTSVEEDAAYNLVPSSLETLVRTDKSINDLKIIAPNTSNNYGKEGYLEVNVDEETTPHTKDKMNIYMLVNDDHSNIYSSKNKRLHSLGYIQYNQNGKYGENQVVYNYHFYKYRASVFGYAKTGIMISDTDDMPKKATDNTNFYTKANKTERYISGIRYDAISYYPLNAKHIQFPSEVIVYNYETTVRSQGRPKDAEHPNGRSGYNRSGYTGNSGSNTSNGNRGGSDTEKVTITNIQKLNKIIKPAYINDIYKLLSCFYDFYYKLNVNYDPTNKLNNIDRFRKTVRRSDVISTESLNNGWLRFQPENYKIIAENKGKITNVVGTGHYLLVHTEHSLFNFDINNSIKTDNKNIQLFTPDVFEVKYKEVFTSANGYGGLQDNVSWILNEHGYIFYDRDANKIYRYDQDKVNDITHNIIKFISDKHYSVHIGDDRKNNRLLFRFVDGQSDKVISYYPGLNRWLSLHDYRVAYKSGNNNANPFVNTKNDLYIIDMGLMGSNVSRFYDKDIEVPKYICDGLNDSTNGYIYNIEKYEDRACSYLDVAFNYPTYDKIKVLDYITYILDKLPNVEGNILKIKLFSNCCYSDVIDINIPRRKVTEYKLPYYNFGKWHFNWFRNKIDKTHVDYVVDRETGKLNPNLNFVVKRGVDNALMTGNYIIIRFIFQNDDIEINIKDIQAYFKR